MKKIITFFTIMCSLSFYGCSDLNSDSPLDEADQALLVIAASRGDFLVFSYIMNDVGYTSGDLTDTVNGTFDCPNDGGTVTLEATVTVVDNNSSDSDFVINATASFDNCYVPYNVCAQDVHFTGTAEFAMSGTFDTDASFTSLNSTVNFLNEDGSFGVELVGSSGLSYELLPSSLSYEYDGESDIVYSGSVELDGSSIDAAVANDQDSSICNGLL